MPSGKVKWFNAKKGYGFITDDKTQKDIFLHVTALEESKLRVLKEDQTIVYDIKEEKDKLQAINIKKKFKNDSLSPVAPYRILNIGNTKKISLLDFISTLEKELNKKIKKHYMPMQKGDVRSTLSDSSLLKRITGYNPKTNYKTGIKKFINWYLNYYN